VLIVSSNPCDAGATAHIMTVRDLPPRESLRSLVSLESRYGMNIPFLFESPSALIQFASARSDLLILAPSRRRTPLFSVTVPLSEPAKSINDNLLSMTS